MIIISFKGLDRVCILSTYRKFQTLHRHTISDEVEIEDSTRIVKIIAWLWYNKFLSY